MSRGRRRLILPVALILLGVCALQGCLYIPTFGTKVAGENAAKKVGDARSRKPLRVGRATRQDVTRLLGEPYIAAADGSAMAYTWTVRNGIAVWPLCFQAYSVLGRRTLVLRFDEQGVLRKHELLKADDYLIQWYVDRVTVPLPEDLQAEKARQNDPAWTMPRPRHWQPKPSDVPGTVPGTLPGPGPTLPPPPPGQKYETPPSP